MKQYFVQICVPPKIKATAIQTPAGCIAVNPIIGCNDGVRTVWQTKYGHFYEIPLLLKEATDFIEMRKILHAMVDSVIDTAEKYDLQSDEDKDVHPFAPHID